MDRSIEEIEVFHNGEKYLARYSPRGKLWLGKPYLEILKEDKIIYKKKSYNTFVLESFFCEEGIKSLLNETRFL